LKIKAHPSYFLSVFVLLAAVPTSRAEPERVTVSIAGTVRDADSGMPIAHAVVSLSTLHRFVFTREDGRYTIDAAPGSQHVLVQRLGYVKQEFEALVPSEGTLEIHIELRRDPITLPPIEVHASVPVRGLERSAQPDYPDRRIGTAAVYHHPLLSEPDVLRAAAGGEVHVAPESPSGIHIRGGASDQVSYLVDGIPVFNPYHAAGTFSGLNPDALSSVDVVTSSSMAAAPEALSGVISANTRTPGEKVHTQGSVSATQARATIDGPVGRSGVGYMLGVSSAFPGLIAHKHEASHIGGENLDWLGKLESPLFGGRARLVGYGSRNAIDAAAAVATGDSSVVDPTRNSFQWDGTSLGVEWMRPLGSASLVLRSWAASGNADVAWLGPDSLEHLASRRRDDGVLATAEFPAAGGTSTAGVRVQRIESSYRLRSPSGDGRTLSLQATTPVSTIFVGHARPVTRRGEIDLSLAGSYAAEDVYISPGAQLRWRATSTLQLSGTAARRHQFAQSLRNSESIFSNIFPADLYVAASRSGVPVASSNLCIVAAEYRPSERLSLACQGYVRDFDGLAIVAPQNADPFGTDFVRGSGTARGVAFEAGASGGNYRITASYGFQRVRLQSEGGEYVPGYGAAHSIQAGVVAYPWPMVAIRLGFEGAFGRRTTATLGAFEWEACNILDQGAEFAGSPAGWSESLGSTRLPAYYRLDLGVRRQWHMKIGQRDGIVAAFGTVTNLLGRTNVLTFAADPSTGQRSPIEMIPLSPLVVGIDWRF
jgi:hypothetical protein